eukprot:scaffold9905_cov117-Isochrysis_galbana.AAC.7
MRLQWASAEGVFKLKNEKRCNRDGVKRDGAVACEACCAKGASRGSASRRLSSGRIPTWDGATRTFA